MRLPSTGTRRWRLGGGLLSRGAGDQRWKGRVLLAGNAAHRRPPPEIRVATVARLVLRAGLTLAAHQPTPLSPAQARVLRAVIAAIRPRGHGFDQPIDDDVLRDVARFLPYLPGPLRIGLPLGLYLVEYGPPLFARRLRRFSAMTPEEGRRYLAGWGHATGLRGALFLGLRTLVFLAFYQHPDVLASLDVDWAGRAATLVGRRAELLHGHAG